MKCYIRERQFFCGKQYKEVDIFGYSDSQKNAVTRKRGTKQRVSAPKQKNLNDRRAKRYFVQLANRNFGAGDNALHLTYDPANLPATYEDAHRIATNYLARIAYMRKKQGLPALKYMLVTQQGRKCGATHRFHHHVLVNGGIDRNILETMWTADRINWKRYHEDPDYKYTISSLGWANADRLQPNKKGISQMAGYIAQDSAGKKHWTQSQNLAPVKSRENDDKYTRRDLEKVAQLPVDSEAFKKYWEKQYRGWELVEGVKTHNDITGWSFTLKLCRMKC